METPRDLVVSAIRDLVAHLQKNPAWPDGYPHEGWVAAEASFFFRTKLEWGVAREAPYVIGEEKKRYADLYARPSGRPLHLLFEFKCISAVAVSWVKTFKRFAADVCTKLPGCDAAGTRDHWLKGKDAWVKYLKHLKPALEHESFVGIGMLFIGLDDERRKRFQEVLDQNTGGTTPLGLAVPSHRSRAEASLDWNQDRTVAVSAGSELHELSALLRAKNGWSPVSHRRSVRVGFFERAFGSKAGRTGPCGSTAPG